MTMILNPLNVHLTFIHVVPFTKILDFFNICGVGLRVIVSLNYGTLITAWCHLFSLENVATLCLLAFKLKNSWTEPFRKRSTSLCVR